MLLCDLASILFTRSALRQPDDDETAAPKSAGVWTMIFTDVHFWVPAIVLLAGLVVLHWIR